MNRLYSIRTGLIGFAFLFIAGTSIVMGIAGSRFASDFLTSRYHESFKLLAENLSKNAELAVLLNNTEDLQRLVSNMLEQKDVMRVKILSSNGKVLAEQRSITEGYEMTKLEIPILTTSIGHVNYFSEDAGGIENVGTVVLGYSLESLDILKKQMIVRLLGLFLVLSLFSFIWYWYFAKSVSDPLEELVALSRNVSAGNMDGRASGGRYYEIKTLAMTFNEMLDTLKQNHAALERVYEEMAQQRSMAELGKFSMMVAHEIKNPLAIIRGSLDILKKKGLSSELRIEMLRYQQEEVDRINRLVEDFLIFSKPLAPEFKMIEMNSFLTDVFSKNSLMWQDSGITFQGENISEKEVWLLCDKSLLNRALSNIIKNAFEACSTGDCVKIFSNSDDTSWTVSICDTGKGIDFGDGNNIFKPFYTTRSKGTGLGLAIVKEIVDLHGGTISAQNQVDKGAMFEIILPLKQNILFTTR